jgi:hypothetical protein
MLLARFRLARYAATSIPQKFVENQTQTVKFANCATEIKIFRIFAGLVFESARLVSELARAVLIHSFQFSPNVTK